MFSQMISFHILTSNVWHFQLLPILLMTYAVALYSNCSHSSECLIHFSYNSSFLTTNEWYWDSFHVPIGSSYFFLYEVSNKFSWPSLISYFYHWVVRFVTMLLRMFASVIMRDLGLHFYSCNFFDWAYHARYQ